MVFHFYPWNLDVDVEETRLLYQENDYAGNREVNERFWQVMSDGQKSFFHSLGVDFMRVEADEKLYDIPDDGDVQGGRISMKTIHFLFRGSFLAIPDFQGELYKDAEVFGSQVPNSLKIVRMSQEKALAVYEVDGWPCVFKHPCFHFEQENFQKWNCGYLLGSILLMKDE